MRSEVRQAMNNTASTVLRSRYCLLRLIDRVSWQRWSISIAALALFGWTSLAPLPGDAISSSAPKSQCVATMEPPYGLEQASDTSLLCSAVAHTARAGLCGA